MTTLPQKKVLEGGHIDVWFCFTDDAQINSQVEQYEQMLSFTGRQNYQQLQDASHKRDYLISRALLRTSIARYCDIAPVDLEFGVNNFGKPKLINDDRDKSLRFNSAHTHGLCVCVVTKDNAIGVDAEYHGDDSRILDAAGDYFSALELKGLQAQSDENKLDYFFRCWTLKEAYIKARGEGLSIPLHDFSMKLDHGEFAGFIGPEAERWDFRLLLQYANYTAALALDGKIKNVRYFNSVPLGREAEITSPEMFRQYHPLASQAGLA